MLQNFAAKFRHKKEEAGGVRNLILHTSFALMLTSGTSYMLGLIRDKIFANKFGAGGELDIYNASFTIPDLFLSVFATAALSAAFVPIFVKIREKSDKIAMEYASKVLSFILTGLLCAITLYAIFVPFFVDSLVPGFSAEQKSSYILLVRLMLLSPLFFTVSNTLGGILISTKDFLWYGISPVLYNLGIILGATVFYEIFGLPGLVLGTITGGVFHMSARLITSFKRGFRFKINFKIDQNIKDTIKLMLPAIIPLALWQVLLNWFVRLSSELPEGSVTVYNFSRNFQSALVSLVGISIALAAFSELSKLSAEGKIEEFKKVVRKKTVFVFGFTTLAALCLALASKLTISILLGGGEFGEESVKLTSLMLAVYCISIPFESLMYLFAKAHYALKNTLRPSLIYAFSILVIIATSAILKNHIGIFSIPVSFAIGMCLQVVGLHLSLKFLMSKLIIPGQIREWRVSPSVHK
ncbi:MAG: virulence factor MVIN family protein, virulence factor [Candidatus Peregrinibacteria bacterium GW2011_GWF2_43_17]|nr:MAG: virulence factor MVIN family protein, virulence factor [Candidatus Peregrinibacteria bacterium GW2011_GWF2_43_17]KKT18675.1 MAG: Virulence factor MVIN family protein [Candidatus Peregrinibacteria bacterium GW2011_GWA2_43_8]HAU39575.1 hypothetical protein [Candidatus Peregrinibacteria bacterium]